MPDAGWMVEWEEDGRRRFQFCEEVETRDWLTLRLQHKGIEARVRRLVFAEEGA